MKSCRRHPMGFSAVELMVTVAIVGISAAILVPNYSKMVASSKQGEVKVQLSHIYSIEKNFALERRSYTQCLKKIGLVQPGSGQVFYSVGINPAGTWSTCGSAGNASCLFTAWDAAGVGTVPCVPVDGFVRANTIAGGSGGVRANETWILGSRVDRDSFVVGAIGNISPSSSIWDRWTIDDRKVLQQTNNGV